MPWLLVVLLAVGALIPFLTHTGLYLAYPFSLDETEGYVLGQIARLSDGGQLYGPIDESPYVVDNYPPAFPVLASAMERVVGAPRKINAILPQPGFPEDDPRSVPVKAVELAHNFAVPRALVVGCFLLALGSMVATWRSESVGWGTVALAAVLIIAQPPVFYMFPLGRADWGALGLGFVALAMAFAGFRGEGTPSAKWLWWAIVPAVLALAFRQSAIMPLLTIGLTLYLSHDVRWKRWTLIALGGVALLLVLFHVIYGPGFWLHTVAYTKTRYLFERLVSTWAFLFRYSALYLLLGILAWKTVRGGCSQATLLPLLYAPLAALTLLLCGKVGSDMNYFLEALFATGWLCGFALQQWLAASRLSTLTATPPPVWIATAVGMVLLQSAYLQNPRGGSYRPNRFDLANGVELVRMLQATPGSVISEEEGMVALAGKPVIFNPFIMSELAREGTWDQSPVVEMLQRGEASVVILREPPNPDRPADRGTGAGWDRFTPEMEQAIATRYQLVTPIFIRREWYVYAPRGESP